MSTEPNKIEELEERLSKFEKRAKTLYEQVDGISKKSLNDIDPLPPFFVYSKILMRL